MHNLFCYIQNILNFIISFRRMLTIATSVFLTLLILSISLQGSSQVKLRGGAKLMASSAIRVSANCLGTSVGGGCWYIGSLGQSCDTICTNVSSIYDPLTLTYAGSSGTVGQCDNVMNALGIDGTNATTLIGSAIGCAYRTSNTTRRVGTTATTSSATNASYRRVCACFIADVKPDAIDWINFNDLSSIQTISGINTPINIQLSASNIVGTAELSYSLNGGLWTIFTTGAPTTLSSVANGSTLQFRIAGNISDSASISISNLSDSGAAIDSVIGTVSLALDITPTVVDWVNFNDISSVQTLTGFNHSITLQLSAVYGTGTPTIQYTLDGTTWIAFSPGSPATLAGIMSGQTLQFLVLGTMSQAATITITNVTDSNTVLDTTTGTVACTGYMYNGTCYYLGASVNTSCDTVCAAVGKTCNLSGTQAISNNITNCSTVLVALGQSPGSSLSSNGHIWACGYQGTTVDVTIDPITTVTCAATNATDQRVCGCQ